MEWSQRGFIPSWIVNYPRVQAQPSRPCHHLISLWMLFYFPFKLNYQFHHAGDEKVMKKEGLPAGGAGPALAHAAASLHRLERNRGVL